jgi:hypothetical protein
MNGVAAPTTSNPATAALAEPLEGLKRSDRITAYRYVHRRENESNDSGKAATVTTVNGRAKDTPATQCCRKRIGGFWRASGAAAGYNRHAGHSITCRWR